jgi:hypothetical protein
MHKRVLPTCRPASIFVFLSLAFGSIIIFANPPLRGPDEKSRATSNRPARLHGC